MSTWTSERSRIAWLAREGVPADDPRVIEAKRNMREGRLAEHIARVVDEAPPLTQEQRDRLALLLRPEVRNGAA